MRKLSNQLVGNVGLFYVCYELSKRGWNCLPTTRNAKGVDIVIYNSKGDRKYTIEVKSLSKEDPAPFGNKLKIMADFVIICTKVFTDHPNIYILKPEEVKKNIHKGKKNKRVSYWLQRDKYSQYKNYWEKIGKGF